MGGVTISYPALTAFCRRHAIGHAPPAPVGHDDFAPAQEMQHDTYGAFPARLLRAQYQHRQETALAWRIKQARLPEAWTIESCPVKRQPGVNPKQIRALADLAFVTKAENLIFMENTRTEKPPASLRFTQS